MKIVLDVPDDAFQVIQGALEQYRGNYPTCHADRAWERQAGCPGLCSYYDRKKPWKFNPKVTMAHRNMVRQAKVAAAIQQAKLVAANAQQVN